MAIRNPDGSVWSSAEADALAALLTMRKPTVNEEEAAFFAAIDADPYERSNLLVFADWLDERGDPRAAGYRELARRKKVPHRFGTEEKWSDWGWHSETDTRFHPHELLKDCSRLPHGWMLAFGGIGVRVWCGLSNEYAAYFAEITCDNPMPHVIIDWAARAYAVWDKKPTGRQPLPNVRLEMGPEGSPNFCFGLYDIETGKSLVFVQSDWDYPGLARSLGWDIASVPTPRHPRTGRFQAKCSHENTDGTVDCWAIGWGCGQTNTTFISAAYDWLAEHDGEEFVCHDYEPEDDDGEEGPEAEGGEVPRHEDRQLDLA